MTALMKAIMNYMFISNIITTRFRWINTTFLNKNIKRDEYFLLTIIYVPINYTFTHEHYFTKILIIIILGRSERRFGDRIWVRIWNIRAHVIY
jgi:hypothetical protein